MQRLHELDGLRGLAALAVVLAHFNVDLFKGTAVAALVAVAHRYSLANLAVAFFYVLSSFLLTTLALRELRGTGAFNRRAFLVRRVARIWPLYWTMLAVNTVVVLCESGYFGINTESWPWLADHLWLYALFLGNWSLALAAPSWHVDRSPPGLGVLWSIAVEEQFYLVYAVLAGVILVSGRRMIGTALVALLLGMAYRTWHLTQYQPFQQLTGIYYATPSYLEMFAFGAAAAWLLADDGRISVHARRLLRSPLALPPILGLLWIIADRWSGSFGHPLGPVAGYPLAALGMSLLVSWSVVNRERLAVRWTLGAWPMRTLGVLSYGIYVWHPIAQGMVTWWLPNANAITALSAYLLLTLLAAVVTYYLVERPFIRLARVRVARVKSYRPGPASTWAL